MFLASIRHSAVLQARPLPMTYVTVAHHLRIRPINARGLGCVADKLFDNVAASYSQGMHAASAGRASRSQLTGVRCFTQHFSLHTKTPLICQLNIVRSRLTKEAAYEKNYCVDAIGRLSWKRVGRLHLCTRRRVPRPRPLSRPRLTVADPLAHSPAQQYILTR